MKIKNHDLEYLDTLQNNKINVCLCKSCKVVRSRYSANAKKRINKYLKTKSKKMEGKQIGFYRA